VPVNRHFVRRCPLLLENDFLSLSPQLSLNNNTLQDRTTGAKHLLQASAVGLIKQLAHGIPYGKLTEFAENRGLHHAQLAELIGFLNTVGGIVRTRTVGTFLKTAQTGFNHLLLGILYTPISWRKQASKGNILQAAVRATMPVTVAMLVVGTIQLWAGLSAPWHIVIVVAYSSVLLIVSIVCHELSHMYIINRAGHACDVLRSGIRLGIIHEHANPTTEITSSLAGPLVGAGICIVLGGVLMLFSQTLLALVSLTTSACHLCGLLPLYGDGKSFVNALRKKREIYEERT
jgi:hypothetical protein